MVARLQLLQEAAAAAARASALLEAAALEADLAEAPLDADMEEGGSPVLCAQAKSQGRKLPALRSPSPSRWVPMASPASEAGAFPAPPPPPPAPPCNWPAAERQQPPPLRKPLRTEEMRSERRRSRTRRRGHTGAERGRGSKLGKRLFSLVRGGSKLVAELATQCDARPEQIRQSVKASPKLALDADDRVAVVGAERSHGRDRTRASEHGEEDRRRRRARDSESTTS